MEYYVKDDHLFIRLEGEVGTLEINKLKSKIISLIDSDQPKLVILDLEEVTFIDSSAIGFLFARYNQLKKINSKLIICGIRPRIKRILEVSGIYQIITCVNSKETEEVV